MANRKFLASSRANSSNIRGHSKLSSTNYEQPTMFRNKKGLRSVNIGSKSVELSARILLLHSLIISQRDNIVAYSLEEAVSHKMQSLYVKISFFSKKPLQKTNKQTNKQKNKHSCLFQNSKSKLRSLNLSSITGRLSSLRVISCRNIRAMVLQVPSSFAGLDSCHNLQVCLKFQLLSPTSWQFAACDDKNNE